LASLFSDNDIILKLSAFGLMDEAVRLAGVASAEVRILSSASPMFRKRKDRLAQKYTIAGVERAIAFVGQATPITQDIHLEDQQALTGIEDLDAGEAILFAAMRDGPEGILYIGDKRSLRALAAAEQAKRVYERLRGKVVCLEEILRALIDAHPFDTIKYAVVPAAGCDEAIRAIFGSGIQSTEKNVRLAIASYISDLERTVGPGWLRTL
jgi:hypothetical protein